MNHTNRLPVALALIFVMIWDLCATLFGWRIVIIKNLKYWVMYSPWIPFWVGSAFGFWLAPRSSSDT